MYQPESVLENETHKIHRDFEIQAGYLIPARRPDQAINKKRKKEDLLNYRLCCPGGS